MTTPFSYVATLNSLLWEHCIPVFIDIDPATYQVSPEAVEKELRLGAEGMLFTHCYGLPCAVDELEALSARYGVPLIYDGAHAFGSLWKDRPLLEAGTMATCSFHATKLMHSVEGGAIVTRDEATATALRRLRNFGHDGPERFSGIGINAKMSEFHAAMGRTVLSCWGEIRERRKSQVHRYFTGLSDMAIMLPSIPDGLDWNGAYFPVRFPTEEACLVVKAHLERHGIFTRRYFYPALHTLHPGSASICPEADSVASRVLCLPLFHTLPEEDIARIIHLIHQAAT